MATLTEGTFDAPVELAPRFATKFNIKIIDIKLFEYVYVSATLFDGENQSLDVKYYMIVGDEYSNWSTDDAYLVDLVKTKLLNDISPVV